MRRVILRFVLVLFLLFCSAGSYAQLKYEFRGVWIATVSNLDWPSRSNLSPSAQQAEFIYILDSLQSLNINAVIVQIRPAADAFYASGIEPWSEFLTGTQGLAPSPYYDPLKFMIQEAHKRNMEFHAWLNPYRAAFNGSRASIASGHITRTHPEWFINYGGIKYFNPGLPEVMEYVNNIVKDIITRYDVDAIHMDDYFYPYRIVGKEFHDEAAYKQYGAGLSKDDWRRSNCDRIIEMLHKTITLYKPMIKFGISPFGVWRNSNQDTDGSNTQAGQTNYDDLYADILLWLEEGWIDYVAPQLYWEIGHRLCDYTTLLTWWSHHSFRKSLYIGLGIYRTADHPTTAWKNTYEIPRQIKLLRENINVKGSIFFSCSNLLNNPNGWADSLKNNYYSSPALIPPMPWIDTMPPKAPYIKSVTVTGEPQQNDFVFSAAANDSAETEIVKSYVVYISKDTETLDRKPFRIIAADSAKQFNFFISAPQIPYDWVNCYVAVTSLDKENNESGLSNKMALIKSGQSWSLVK